MSKLEPIRYERGQLILDELDQVNEVTFILDDDYYVGYSINRAIHYKLRLKRFSIGDYYLTEGKRSEFAFKASC